MRDLINGHGLLLEFTDNDPALGQRLPFGHTTVEMITGYSVSCRTVHGPSGSARSFIGLLIAVHLVLIAAFVRRLRPVHHHDPPGQTRIRQPARTGADTCSGSSWDRC